jgi:hypothetical protein
MLNKVGLFFRMIFCHRLVSAPFSGGARARILVEKPRPEDHEISCQEMDRVKDHWGVGGDRFSITS